jgi:DNA-binding MarR family transcriptional regulator
MKQNDTLTEAGDGLTELMLATFRLNGRLLAAGDRLVAGTGLTSARWQALGALAKAGTPQTVSQIAHGMGLTRQAVQRVVNDLVAAGMLHIGPNPHHRRAGLVAMTEAGATAYAGVMARHAPWANGLAEGMAPAEVWRAVRLLHLLGQRLEVRAREAEASEAEGDAA